MKKQIVINASKDRSRIAIVEDGELVELYVENPDNVRTIGNIYLGRIQKVMPAIRAAFVDVGQKQDCFLHFSDLTDNFPQILAMTGEEVPGLDEPVLSLAPAKRVADDDAEPDVEEKLEIEPAEETSQSRRTRGRRSRGRGRGRGGRRRSEEEEEQEEGKRLPSVIDLTSPSRPRRPAPKPTPEPASEPDEPTEAETTDEAPAPEEAPAKKSRSRRKTRNTDDAPAEESPKADAPEADDADDSSTDDAEAKPKKRRRRRRRGGRGRNRGGQSSDGDDSDNSKADDRKDPRPNKSAKSDKSEQPAEADAASSSDPEADANRPKPLPASIDLTGGAKKDDASGRSRRRTRSQDESRDHEASASESDAETESTSETSSSTSRSRRSRGRSKDADTSSDDKESKGRSGRGRGRGSDNDSDKDDTSSSDEKKGGGRSDRSRGGSKGDRGGRSKSSKSNVPIPPNEQLLKRDGRIIVKITKEPISTKGPRVSTDLSLAGRFLVLVPAADYVAVSKKIESAKERRRLRTLATSLKPDGFGVIVRTVAENRDAKSLDTDLRLLVDKWRKIEKKLNQKPEPPVLLYEDVNMVSSIIRDLFSDDYDRILVDDPKVFKNVQAYVKAVAPQMADKVEMHRGSTPVYRSLGIEKQVEEAFSKRVNMRGGGYLYIETTEAMHVVDVNSGRAGRGKSQKENLIAVNVEAAREVAKQLRLRDLGGIIVVDFIDLRYDRDRKKVTDALKEAFKKDRAVTKLLPMSDFGLVQITRQRLRPSITTQGDDDGEPRDASAAAAAAGAGEIQPSSRREPEPQEEPRDERPEAESRAPVAPEDATPQALSGRLRGWLDHYRRTVDDRYKNRPIVVRVHPLFGAYLRRGFPSPLTRWRLAIRGIAFHLEEDAGVDPLGFEVRDQKSGRSLLKKYAA